MAGQKKVVVSNQSGVDKEGSDYEASPRLGHVAAVQPASPSAIPTPFYTTQPTSQTQLPSSTQYAEQNFMHGIMVQRELNVAYRHFANMWIQSQLLQQWHQIDSSPSPMLRHASAQDVLSSAQDPLSRSIATPPPPYEGSHIQMPMRDKDDGKMEESKAKLTVGMKRQLLNQSPTPSGKRHRDHLMGALGLMRINSERTEDIPEKRLAKHAKLEKDCPVFSDKKPDVSDPVLWTPCDSVSQRFAQEFHEQVFRETFLNDKRDVQESTKMINEWRTELERHRYGKGK